MSRYPATSTLYRHLLLVMIAFAALSPLAISNSAAWRIESGEAQWIWSPEFAPGEAPEGFCYFRKRFNINNPERATIEITCDDRYELWLNGRHVGSGDDWRTLNTYDIQRFLVAGSNLIAVKAENQAAGAAGLVARVTVRRTGNTDVSYSTDATWRTSLVEEPNWQQPSYRDNHWVFARSLGELGRAEPWGDRVVAAGGGRFKVASNFAVERVAHPDDTGSLVAMTFNERGEMIASRERGPLLLMRDSNGDGAFNDISTYCDEVQNCQGILALNGMVFAVGDGPDGTAFYKIQDQDGDGAGETVSLVFKFRGGMGEHGPHAAVLGPDGLIYLMIGNHSGIHEDYEIDPASPHHHYYEGDLVQPRYEDAGGHAHGVKAPGGIVVRTDLDGNFIEMYCGGFRNAYDLAFNRQGDLFTFDSDMEWDEGLPWYRPCRVNHAIPGAEFGWRSGWAKWPEYYVDSLPATVNIGRGSPTGVTFYNHYMFPTRYHNALFVCDWSMGRILCVKMQPEGGTYEARSEVFVAGRPLNVTDIEVGPDGWLYFSTGGRGTEGGIYRIVYQGPVPPRATEQGVMQAIRQPQLSSAWGRDRIAVIKREMGDAWSPELARIADNPQMPVDDRTRALDLMQLVGPFPATSFLVKLSRDSHPEMRAKATYLMGLHVDDATNERLVQLLDDPDATVRRKACEALVLSGHQPPVSKLIGLLADPNRFVAWSARRALQQVPTEDWQSIVLASPNPRIFVEGAAALLPLDPDRAAIDGVIENSSRLMRGFINDNDFLALLRVLQLAMLKGEISGDDVPEFRAQLAEEYPSLEPRMNRELVRLLVHLQEPSVLPRMFDELSRQDNPLEEKLHLAAHLRFLQQGWNFEQKLELLRYYEYARDLPGGHSFKRYMDNFNKDFVGQMSEEEQRNVLRLGRDVPTAALAVLARLPEEISTSTIEQLAELDRQITGEPTEAAKLLQTGIVAVLGASRDPVGMDYLRHVFETQPDRRQEVAMGLAQEPEGENWPLLIRALPIVEGGAAAEVLIQLARADQVPESPEPVRQAILTGLKLGDDGSQHAVALLEKWTGQTFEVDGDAKAALAEWQNWFRENFPNEPDPSLPKVSQDSRWTFDELLKFLDTPEGSRGSPQRGAEVFVKAECIKCHRFGDRGEGIGPDLTTVAQRFQKKEILESVLFPSQVISDQYASKTVVTLDGRTFTGIVGESGPTQIIVLQSNGEKQVIDKDNIDEMVPHAKSSMPEGLFNELTLDEIADLFAYLMQAPTTARLGR